MALEKKRTLSALTVHFATVDIRADDGSVVVPAGQSKHLTLEYATWVEEDGVAIPGSFRRDPATIAEWRSDATVQQVLSSIATQAIADRIEAQAREAELRTQVAGLRDTPQRDNPTTEKQ